MSPKSRWSDLWWWLLIAALVFSAALRLRLVERGGQMLWPDESRYTLSREAVGHLATHDHGAAVRALVGSADHLFFKVLGLLPATVEHHTGSSNAVAAGFFAGFSVLNILLVWCIARAAGAAMREATVAAWLMAGAATHFYYARHLFPYDAALSFGLLALWTGWRPTAGPGRSLACGALAALGFLTYNGAWLFGAMVLAGHVLLAWREKGRMLARAGWGALGLTLPIAGVIALARLLADTDLVASFVQFSRSITQGDFGRGWKLLGEYFWAAEGFNLVLGVVGVLLVAAGALAARAWSYGMRWVAGIVFLLAGLLLLSDVWPKFVIYGRTARVLVPLVCLASAFALERLWRAGGRAAALAGLAAVLALGQAGANFWPPLVQEFPAQFNRRAALLRDDLRQRGEKRQLVTIYADMVVGRASLLEALPDHDVLLASPNPMQYRPYLSEGYVERTRVLLEQTDFRMRLIAVNQARFDYPSELRLPYPGMVKLTLRLPRDRPGQHEPLMVTGETGAGDFIYLVYESAGTVRVGYDHWGVAGKLSEPLPVDYETPAVIKLSAGSLHDPAAAPEEGPDLRQWLHVEINDRVIWSHPAKFHPAPAASIAFGVNFIGGSTAGNRFSGEILKVQSLRSPQVTVK